MSFLSAKILNICQFQPLKCATFIIIKLHWLISRRDFGHQKTALVSNYQYKKKLL